MVSQRDTVKQIFLLFLKPVVGITFSLANNYCQSTVATSILIFEGTSSVKSSSTILREAELGSNAREPANSESEETRDLTLEQLKRLVLLEQLQLIRLQTAHHIHVAST